VNAFAGGSPQPLHDGSPPAGVSIAHSNVASASSEEKANVADRTCVVACGRSSTVVSGAAASTIVQAWVTAGCSTMSNAFVAWTTNSCSPAARFS
jgi:hypothetical protein